MCIVVVMCYVLSLEQKKECTFFFAYSLVRGYNKSLREFKLYILIIAYICSRDELLLPVSFLSCYSSYDLNAIVPRNLLSHFKVLSEILSSNDFYLVSKLKLTFFVMK